MSITKEEIEQEIPLGCLINQIDEVIYNVATLSLMSTECGPHIDFCNNLFWLKFLKEKLAALEE